MKKQNTYKGHIPFQSEFDHKFACWAFNHTGWAKMKKFNKKIAKKRERRELKEILEQEQREGERMKIVDARPLKTSTKFCELKAGELFYLSDDEEGVYIKVIMDDYIEYGIRLNDGVPSELYSSAVVKRIKGHLVVERVENEI